MEKLHVETKNLFANISDERKTRDAIMWPATIFAIPIKHAVLPTDWRKTVGEVSIFNHKPWTLHTDKNPKVTWYENLQ